VVVARNVIDFRKKFSRPDIHRERAMPERSVARKGGRAGKGLSSNQNDPHAIWAWLGTRNCGLQTFSSLCWREPSGLKGGERGGLDGELPVITRFPHEPGPT